MYNNTQSHLTFEKFNIFENVNIGFFKKVAFLRFGDGVSGLTSKNSGKLKKYNTDAIHNLYYSYFTESSDVLEYKDGLPMVYYGGNNQSSLDFLKNNKVNTKLLYNNPDTMKVSGNKILFHKKFSNLKFIPRTVFSVKDAKTLKFPIIAKPNKGHSGIGITVFKTFDELSKSKNKYGLFSEFIKSTTEFRVLLMKDEIIEIDERIQKNTVESKKKDDSLDFVYVEQNLDTFSILDDIKKFIRPFTKELNLGVWSLDIIIGENGSQYVVEINTATGLGASKLALLYIAVYNDFYQKPLSKKEIELLYSRFITPTREILWKTEKQWILKSKERIDYTSL